MLICLSDIRSFLNPRDIRHSSPREDAQLFLGVSMWEPGTETTPGNIYFARASALDKPGLQSVALVISDDAPYDYSSLTCDYLVIDPKIDIGYLLNRALRFVQKAAARGLIVEETLTKLCRGCGLNETISLSRSMLENPVILFVAVADVQLPFYSLDKEETTENLLPLYPSYNVDDLPGPERQHHLDTLQKSLSMKCPILLEDGVAYSGHRRLLSPIRTADGGKILGYMAVVEFDRSLTRDDYVSLYVFCNILADKLRSAQYSESRFTLAVFHQDLTELINGGQFTSSMDWLSQIGGRIRQSFRLVYSDVTELPRSKLEQLEVKLSFSLKSSLLDTSDGNLLILMNPADDAEYVSNMELLRACMVRNRLIAGTSCAFDDIRSLSTANTQCRLAYKYAQTRFERSGCYEFEPYKYEILLSAASGASNAKYLISGHWTRLCGYDRKNNTSYCRTVLAYLECNMNRKEVCRVLGIHKNTLSQRIEKIERILQCGINDHKMLIDMYFSAMIDGMSKGSDKS